MNTLSLLLKPSPPTPWEGEIRRISQIREAINMDL